MIDDYEIKGEFQERYRYAHDFWSPFTTNAQIYTLGASGYTWSDAERKALSKEGREPIEYNLMRRPLQYFSGYLRDHLKSVVAAPVESSDQKTADQFTKLQYEVWEKADGYTTFLDSCDEALKAGISLCGLEMDYSNDFINGNISFYKRTFNSFYLDPTFTKLDLSDCSYAVTRDLLDKNIAKQLLPFIDPKMIDEIQGSWRDDKFLSYHPNFTTLARNKNMMAYDQYYRRIAKDREFLVDEEAGYFRDITDISKEELDKLKVGLNRIRRLHDDAEDLGIENQDIPPLVDIRTVSRDFVELNIMLNGICVYQGDDKTGIVKTFPFVPLLCYFEPSIWMPSQRIQGIPATIWSLNREFNKRHMKITDMMDSTISTGFKYLIGSVPDPQDMQQSGQNKLIGIDPENAPEGLNSVQELTGGGANPSLIEYQSVLDQLSLTLTNVNESALGIDEGGNTEVSGRLAQVRASQGLKSNRKVFDNIEKSQMLLGGLVMQVLQNKYTPNKIKRIIGEEPTQQFYDKDFEVYDCVLKEGIRSSTQRDAYYFEIYNLAKDGLVDVPPSEFVKNLPMGNASELQEAIEAKQQQDAEMQQQQMKMQLELAQAEIDDKKALAHERNTRSDANEGLRIERSSEAVQNEAQANLDRAKALSEISQLNENRLFQAINLLREIEAENQQKMASKDQEVDARADEEDPDQKNAKKEIESITSEMQMEGNNPQQGI